MVIFLKYFKLKSLRVRHVPYYDSMSTSLPLFNGILHTEYFVMPQITKYFFFWGGEFEKTFSNVKLYVLCCTVLCKVSLFLLWSSELFFVKFKRKMGRLNIVSAKLRIAPIAKFVFQKLSAHPSVWFKTFN